MSGLTIGIISVVAVFLLIYIGMHVAVALALVSFVGLWLLKGKLALSVSLLVLAVEESISSFVFGVVPLFILMGYFVSVSDIGRDAFRAANYFVGRLKGGLGVATISASAAFAAVTGISIASAAVFTKVAVPEMRRLGYHRRFAVGVVAGSSVLGMLIPPSLLLIIYALVAEQSVGHMFVAGIVPGLILTLAFAATVIGMSWLMPQRVQSAPLPQRDKSADLNFAGAVASLLPMVLLIGAVLGGIYGGAYSPTEAGAVGAFLALLLALFRRKLTWSSFWRTLVDTGHTTVAISILIIAATIYSRMLSISGMPNLLADWIGGTEIQLGLLILVYIAIVILMGTIIDATSIILIVVPIFLPLVKVDPSVSLVWFGIITVIAAEIGLLTPPLGLSAFVVKSSLDDPTISLGDIFAGAFPFVLVMVLVLFLLIALPSLTLLLL